MATRSLEASQPIGASPEEVRAELDAVCRSRTFERSERLQRFLRYVCDLSLKGEASRINEYLIASDVFDRGPDYSPSEDSVVRRQAHALRHKLQEYYLGEGRADAVHVELPIGHYVPVFRHAEPQPAATQLPAPVPLPLRRGGKRVSVAWVSIAVVAGLAVGWFIARRTQQVEPRPIEAKFHPAVLEIWRPWFEDLNGAVICFSNPMTTVIKHFPAEPPDAPPNRARATPGEEKRYREAFKLPAGGLLYSTTTWSQTKMGEAISAVHLADLFGRAGIPFRSTQSRFLSWDDLRGQNLILMGHNEANRWLDPLLEKYPLRLTATTGEFARAIVNAEPRAGEEQRYQIRYSPNGDLEYALVSMVPGIDGRHKLLLINGLNAQATQMAAEFLTQPESLMELISRLRKAKPDHKGPWHFQLVVAAEVRDKVPTRASMVVLRVL